MTPKSRYKVGARQLAVLRALSKVDQAGTQQLVRSIDRTKPGSGGYASTQAATRRALALLKAKGLVTDDRTTDTQGQPTLWRITNEGRVYLKEHRQAPPRRHPDAL
jgi:hypothetical protein